MINYLRTYPIRHALSVGLAVLSAVIINYYFSFSKEGWIILAAFLVSQTTRGTPLKQGLSYFFIIMIIAIIMPANNMHLMHDRVIDSAIGGILGILFGQFVLPVRIYSEFSLGVVPVLQALKDYLQAFSLYFHRDAHSAGLLIEKRRQIEAVLAARRGTYPEWVYEVGFNPGLRAGFRFFLVNLERITEIFFSMSYLADRGVDTLLLADFSSYFVNVAQKNEELLRVLIDYFNENKLKNTESETDFTSDMVELEKALNRLIPGSLDLLDLSPDYVTLTAFVRDLKDLRGLLLQLVMALPAATAA